MRSLTALSVALLVVAGALLPAQGSQRPIGGGCPNRSAPVISGPLARGTIMSVDNPGCFTGQNGYAFLFLGPPLPPPAWVAITLTGPATCFVVLQPLVSAPVSSSQPLSIPIPADPRLRGAIIGLQTFCHECGFAGCFDLLTQGVEITIG